MRREMMKLYDTTLKTFPKLTQKEVRNLTRPTIREEYQKGKCVTIENNFIQETGVTTKFYMIFKD